MIVEDLLDAIYAVSTSEGALRPLVERLALQFDCPSAALVYLDPGRPSADVSLAHGLFAGAALVRYVETYAAIDPAPAALAALPIGTAAATDRLFSVEERAASRFLREFYHPLGLREALGAPITRADGQFGILAVHRGRERPPFTDREIAAFGEIARHVARAVALRSRFFVITQAAALRRDMLDGVVSGVMTVDRSGQLVDANAAARAVLACADGLLLTRSGRVCAADRVADADFRAALARDGKTGPTIVVVPRAGDARIYALKVSRRAGEAGLAGNLCVIHIADDRAPVGDVETTLVQALRLSAPSARLAAALLRGTDLRDYARQAGITENTAKFHLRSAFRATGTHRQSELIRLAVGTLRDLAV